jgi:beta-glucosidase
MTGSIANADKADIVAAMRTAMHNVCYTVVNSNAMNGLAPGSSVKYGIAPWQYGVYGGTAVLVALGAFLGYRAVKTNKALAEQKARATDDTGDGNDEEG